MHERDRVRGRERGKVRGREGERGERRVRERAWRLLVLLARLRPEDLVDLGHARTNLVPGKPRTIDVQAVKSTYKLLA